MSNNLDIDFFQAAHHQSFEEAIYVPSAEHTLKRMWKEIVSGNVTELGLGSDGEFLIADSERIHTHVIGEPGVGKSRFLQHLIRKHIDKNEGCLLIDQSKTGGTAYDVLSYCCYKGVKKIIFIDPFHATVYSKIIGLNPLQYDHIWGQASAKNVEDIIQVLFNTKDLSNTPNVQMYLKAILKVLVHSKKTVLESEHFTGLSDPEYVWEILKDIPEFDHSRRVLEEVFWDPKLQMELRSTGRRLDPMFGFPMSFMLFKQGVDFMRVVADGWVVICALNAPGFGQMDRKLLATLLNNQVFFSAERLKRPDLRDEKNVWGGRYHLYLDEAGEYANWKLEEMMSLGRQTGLRVTIAHQHFSQFEDRMLLKGIRNSSNVKVAFHIQDAADRMEIVKDMYGGNLSDRDVAYHLSKMTKREAIVKVGSGDAAKITIPRVEKVPVSNEELLEYLMWIYSQDFYYSVEEVKNEVSKAYPKRSNPKVPTRGASTHHGTVNKSTRSKGKQRTDSTTTPTRKQRKTNKDKNDRPEADPFTLAEKLKGTD